MGVHRISLPSLVTETKATSCDLTCMAEDDRYKELVNAILQFRLLAEVLEQDDPDTLIQVHELLSELEDELQGLEGRTTLTAKSNQPE
jgi:hypothetical protein